MRSRKTPNEANDTGTAADGMETALNMPRNHRRRLDVRTSHEPRLAPMCTACIGVLAVVSVLLWLGEKGVPERKLLYLLSEYRVGGDEPKSMWKSLLAITSPKSVSATSNDEVELRVLLVGDSITEGSAERTLHPRFHPNGSCSFRMSFFEALASNVADVARESASNSAPLRIRAVGPFSSNCGSSTIPARCWAPTTSKDLQSQWARHGATSGITTYGVLHGETWAKRIANYQKAGLEDAPPAPAEVQAMEQRYRDTFRAADGGAANISDLAVWAATYQPHLSLVLLGTNDLRWLRSWEEVLTVRLPQIVAELLVHASPITSVLLNDSANPAGTELRGVSDRRITCHTFVAVSTLFPRFPDFAVEVQAFNTALLDIRRNRRRNDRSACDNPSRANVLLCHPCVRIVNGGATLHRFGKAGLPYEDFVKRYTFDGLHPNDEGDVILGERLAREVRDS